MEGIKKEHFRVGPPSIQEIRDYFQSNPGVVKRDYAVSEGHRSERSTDDELDEDFLEFLNATEGDLERAKVKVEPGTPPASDREGMAGQEAAKTDAAMCGSSPDLAYGSCSGDSPVNGNDDGRISRMSGDSSFGDSTTYIDSSTIQEDTTMKDNDSSEWFNNNSTATNNQTMPMSICSPFNAAPRMSGNSTMPMSSTSSFSDSTIHETTLDASCNSTDPCEAMESPCNLSDSVFF
jgi:hypothetical protein